MESQGNQQTLISTLRNCHRLLNFCLVCLTRPDCIQQMFCPAAAGHSTTPNTHTRIHTHTHTHTHFAPNPCHILDTAWGPWCRKEATWGPKSSVAVGWLCNLIARIVSFFFSVVKFLFFCSFLASSCATYSCQTSAGPDITARLLGHHVIGWRTACEHRTVPLNINEVTRKHN